MISYPVVIRIDSLITKSKLRGMKKAFLISLACIFGILVVISAWFISTNNTLVSLNEKSQEKWSQVENVYQRRADLIPNLVNTVKGYAKHESQVFEEVTRARAQAGQVQLRSLGDLQKFDAAQNQLTQSLSRLLVITERYPELKADKNFLELQSQLEGTENRISIERMRLNETIREYNSYLKKFPQSIVAELRNFKERPYFQAESTAKITPKAEF